MINSFSEYKITQSQVTEAYNTRKRTLMGNWGPLSTEEHCGNKRFLKRCSGHLLSRNSQLCLAVRQLCYMDKHLLTPWIRALIVSCLFEASFPTATFFLVLIYLCSQSSGLSSSLRAFQTHCDPPSIPAFNYSLVKPIFFFFMCWQNSLSQVLSSSVKGITVYLTWDRSSVIVRPQHLQRIWETKTSFYI